VWISLSFMETGDPVASILLDFETPSGLALRSAPGIGVFRDVPVAAGTGRHLSAGGAKGPARGTSILTG